jgi:hypothetical protein
MVSQRLDLAIPYQPNCDHVSDGPCSYGEGHEGGVGDYGSLGT